MGQAQFSSGIQFGTGTILFGIKARNRGGAPYHLYRLRMGRKRSDIVDEAHSGVYHCISRCVRRESLLSDPRRRGWIVEQLEFLAQYGAIDVLAFCVMENHLHLLLRTRPEVAAAWPDHEIALRKVTLLARHRKHSKDTAADAQAALKLEVAIFMKSPERVRTARRDLSSLSFFHKLLKEPCAKKWNREDKVTGHFWEGRFKSPKVLDQGALENVAGYIELNEIHACAATSIPSSIWTSAQIQWQRFCDGVKRACLDGAAAPDNLRKQLLDLRWEPVFPCQTMCSGESTGDTIRSTPTDGNPVSTRSLLQHLHCVDQAGRRRRLDKAGWIPDSEPDAVGSAIARVHASLSRGSQVVRLAAHSVATWWSELREGLTSSLLPILLEDGARSLLNSTRGSCYGSRESIALEATRRGVKRMLPVWSSV